MKKMNKIEFTLFVLKQTENYKSEFFDYIKILFMSYILTIIAIYKIVSCLICESLITDNIPLTVAVCFGIIAYAILLIKKSHNVFIYFSIKRSIYVSIKFGKAIYEPNSKEGKKLIRFLESPEP